MAIYNPLSWQNENGLAGYPFKELLEVQEVIVDAKLTQFDGYIPILNAISIDDDKIKLFIQFDFGEGSCFLLKDTYNAGSLYRSVKIYTPNNDRCLGSVTFGDGTEVLWRDYVGRKLIPGISFIADVVRSIPSKDAVYTFDGMYGDVKLSRTQEDSAIFYNLSTELNSITLNAVGGHAVADSALPQGLKMINLVSPVANNINLSSNDVIKISSQNSSSLNISLVSGAVAAGFKVPSLNS